MTKRSKLLKYVVFVSAIFLVFALGISFMIIRSTRLKPRFLGSVDASSLPTAIEFSPKGVAFGNEVDSLSQQFTNDPGPYFATKEVRAVAFKPDPETPTYGDIVLEGAEKGRVYFYRYDRKFRMIVQGP